MTSKVRLPGITDGAQRLDRLFRVWLASREPVQAGRRIEVDGGERLADFVGDGGRHRVHRHQPRFTFPVPRRRRQCQPRIEPVGLGNQSQHHDEMRNQRHDEQASTSRP